MTLTTSQRALETRTVRGTASGLMPSTAAGDPVLMCWVPEDRIPAEHRAYVRRRVDRAARRMGLGHIAVRWFGPPIDLGDSWGYDFGTFAEEADAVPIGVVTTEFPMTIGLLATMRGPAVDYAVAHEVRHVAQNVARLMLDDKNAREEDAHRFASTYISEEGS